MTYLVGLLRVGVTLSVTSCLVIATPGCKSAPPRPSEAPNPAASASPIGVDQKSPSGLVTQVVRAGSGNKHPAINDSVKVNFATWTASGAPVTHGEGVSFPLTQAIPAWQEALPQMVAGERRHLWIPQNLSGDELTQANTGPLLCELELLDVTPPPPAPPDVATPPSEGLASKVVVPGTGAVHPRMGDMVGITFASWTKGGAPLDRAQQVYVPVASTVPAWRKALTQMVVGETRRLWVPSNSSRGGGSAAPADTTVFDITLLDVLPGGPPPPDVAAPPAGLTRSKDGLVSEVVVGGSSREHPEANDWVRVRVTTWHRDGDLVATTGEAPVVRPVSAHFAGWTEALRSMAKGEERMVWIPATLGPEGADAGEPRVDLTMQIELIDIFRAPKAPPHIEKPPRKAVVDPSGLASVVLNRGSGANHPLTNSLVTVRYSAWTTGGALIESSVTQGAPATVLVGSGWTQALLSMVPGEKRRVWIPSSVAYPGEQGEPKEIVFDLELLSIQS
jgi:peptidylprolyl isomerase